MSDSWRSSACARRVSWSFGVLLLVLAVPGLWAAAPARAATVPSVYYVPKPEAQLRSAYLNLCPTAGTTMHTVVSIVASADNAVIYYDEWEDGYESDPSVRTQTSTQVWGDNDPSNGIPPGYATDVLNSGDVIALENDVPVPRVATSLFYDGGDKIAANRMLAVTRAGWALNPGTVLAGAGEVHRTLDWGLDYRSPVGTNVSSADQRGMFLYTGMLIMASQDGTQVQIDADNNGGFETTTTLAQGESYLVNGGVRVGGHVVASKPVQVDVITGDTAATYESRSFSLFPTSLWSGTYYSPVGSTVRQGTTETTYVFVYNPNSAAISVTMRTVSGDTTNNINAGTYRRYTMPTDGGAQFFSASSQPFFAVTCVGARYAANDTQANQVYDWGFSLIPQSSLTTMAIVGWGPGRDAASSVNPTENASPVWVTPVAGTTVYVDYDADPTTGPLTDPYGSKYDVAYTTTAWQSRKVYDTVDRNQTGMRLYTLDNTLIATAWGQDPATASPGAPALDLGTTVLPLPEFTVSKTSTLYTDVDGDGFIDPGDTITYTIRVNGIGPAPLFNVVVTDPLPANTTYVANSTTYALYTAAPSAVADDASGTAYPLDGTGKTVAFVTPYQYFTYTFRARIDSPLPAGVSTISNTVTAKMNVASMAQTADTTVGGTLSTTRFAHAGDWITVDTYSVDALLYIETADLDQNMNPGVAETVQVTVTSATGGDSETITLTETGPDTGIFRGTLQSSGTGGSGNDNGVLRAPLNDVLTARYVDPDFPADTSSAVANIRPTLALVSNLSAWAAPGSGVVVGWRTQSEWGTLGFDLLRLDPGTGEYRKVNQALVPGLFDSPLGGDYRVTDPIARSGHEYTYLLRELEADGATYDYGPFTTRVRVAAKGAQAPASGMKRVARPAGASDAARVKLGHTTERVGAEARAARVGARVKIASTRSGLVLVTAAKLADPMGLSAARIKQLIKSGGLALSYRDAPVAYLPARDGSSFVFFDPGATGTYSDANVFWVQPGQGRLMRNAKATSAGASASAASATFAATARAEEHLTPVPRLYSDPEADFWLWDCVFSGVPSMATKTFPVRVPGAAGSGSATLVLRLIGVLASASGAHHVSVTVNGTAVGEGQWAGAATHELTLALDGALLADGANQVGLTAETDAAGSLVYVDSIAVRYQRRYVADDGSLLARGDGNSPVTVDGFADAAIRVLDLSNPAAPAVAPATVTAGANQGFRVTFTPTAATTPYLAADASASHEPASLVADVPSILKTKAKGAQYVIVAPTALCPSAQRLADYRAARGLTSKVVDLEDIYDEFNGGMASPLAIKSFLAYAFDNWRQAPRFVVLAGAGTFDYKDYSGCGGNFVPPLMVSSPDGLVASDQRLADVRGDDSIPEMVIGRLPVVSAAELDAQVTRIAAYEASSGEWIDRALFVADDADRAGDFPACSDALANLLATPYRAQKIYVKASDPAAARAELLQAWNQGAAFVSYLGHAGLQDLTSDGLFGFADATALSNGAKMPVTALMTCAAGDFAVPGADALAETLVLNPNGGASAVWSSSGLSRNPDALVLDEGLVRALFVDGEQTLGSAVLDSMRAYAASGRVRYNLDTYNLLGDPALAVR